MNDLYGVGAIIRNNQGELLCASYWPQLGANSVGQAELLAICLGLKLLRDFHVKHLFAFYDVVGKVSNIFSYLLPSNEDRFIIDEVKRLGVISQRLKSTH